MTTIDFALITYRPEGIKRVAENNLPILPGVRYVVSWQSHENTPIPPELIRQDILIYRYDGKGLSNNRNNAISHCTADVIVFADDDIELYPDGIRKLQETYSAHPEIDFLSFRAILSNKIHPDKPVKLDLPLPACYYIASVEISFRRSAALLCCPELGLNSPYMHGGEDEILLVSALKRGLNCWYFPITVSRHEHASTGTRTDLSSSYLRASGCVIALTYPWWQTILRLPLKAWRLHNANQSSFLRALIYLTEGAILSGPLLRRNRNSLW
ncbi:MAG: glycosyltransferase family 2 protein [Duncaniella sp.]|nr:glycosyltransferase family 2 protein [Duncaniella sp.]